MGKKASIVILSNTIDDEIFNINCNCINSLINSENWDAIGGLEILLIENNRKKFYNYNNNVRLYIPEEPFNYNRFLNLGVELSRGRYVVLCNNDIIFSQGWFTEILKVHNIRKDILCFSPIDRDYKTMSYELFPTKNEFYIGWDNKFHFSAWCFILDRKIFSLIGKLDERFDFYYADDDFLLTLRKNSIKNALITHSHVKHLSQQVTRKIDEIESPKIVEKGNFPIPEKYLQRGFSWLWDDKRFYDAFFKMEDKWGDEKMIRRMNRFLDLFPFLRLRLITRLLYTKWTINILSRITGI